MQKKPKEATDRSTQKKKDEFEFQLDQIEISSTDGMRGF